MRKPWGVLTTQSPLHIGTGEEHQEEDASGQKNTINSIALDTKGKPYIPASTLRGNLRALCPDSLGDEHKIKIYGDARQHKDSDKIGRSGAMRIYDARLQENQTCQIQNMSRTSIDPITNTAKHHHLSTHAQISANTKFTVEIHLDKINDAEIITILASLDALKHGRIGKGKSIGQGQISWQIDKKGSELLYKNKLADWIKAKKKFALKYTSLEKLIDKHSGSIMIDSDWQTQEIQLKALSPLIINDPHTASQLAKKYKDANDDSLPKPPDCLMLQSNGKAVIPASTLKGWMRAHCSRILKTISDSPKIESLLNELFGSTETGMSKLHFNDILIDRAAYNEHPQSFIAIDRFTGGAKDGDFCDVKAIIPKDLLNTRIRYQAKNLKDWMKILLLYVARDAIEGDLVLGWGKSKGFGCLEVQADFKTLCQQYDDQLETWQAALERELKSTKENLA